MDIKDILAKYSDEIKDDTNINQLNLKDIQMKLPSIRHKWVARLINHKQAISELRKLKEEAKSQLVEKLSADSNVTISPLIIEKKAESTTEIIAINKNIKDQDLIVEYLEKVEVIMKSMTYDISNLVKIMELEEL